MQGERLWRPQLKRLLRYLRVVWLRRTRNWSLAQRFLLVAGIVIAVAALGRAGWMGQYVQRGIVDGVAATAAASIDTLVAHHIGELPTDRPLTADEQAQLDEVFEIGNSADQTRLLQIRIRDLSGQIIYSSSTDLVDGHDEDDHVQRAISGRVSSRLLKLNVAPVGDLAGYPIDVLEIYTPLHRSETGEPFALAELYFSAKAVMEQRDRAQLDVWLVVAVSSLAAVAAIYVLVDWAGATISRQRARLAENLAASRRLNEENRRLHLASEELRQNANSANEALLAQVGSDIHDGPIQVLTLIILRLSKSGLSSAELAATAALASEAMEELRNISNGLVLPELADLSLAAALHLAVDRHEALTGVRIRRDIDPGLQAASLMVKICAYRVIQEALNNAFRHGAAAGQTVTARHTGGSLCLRVCNRPRAVVSKEKRESGLGLRGMRFRVESLGGWLRTEISEDSESRVEAQIPLGMRA